MFSIKILLQCLYQVLKNEKECVRRGNWKEILGRGSNVCNSKERSENNGVYFGEI